MVGEDTWTIAETTDTSIEWSPADLKKGIEDALFRISTTRKVLLLLDGLDELEGDDSDRQEMLTFLHRLVQFENVKLCVSSRPWNIFNDFFHDFPKLHLQDLTRNDIGKYVRHSLSYSMHLQSTYLHNSGEGESLIGAIVDKASGVFLWVRLVVQELLRGFRDGETIRTLRRKVDTMPEDLNGFFKRIIDSIDPAYRKEGSAFLQTALFSLQDNDIDWPRGLLEFTFLEAEDPEFVAKSDYDFSDLNFVDLDALEYRIDLGKRRLNSRCMGLLEWVNSSLVEKFTAAQPSDEREAQLLYVDVNFLHRSLMDFLVTPDAQEVLQQFTAGPFRAKHFLCSALLTKIVAITKKCSESKDLDNLQDMFLTWFVGEETDRVLRALSSAQDLSQAALNVFLVQLDPTLQLLRTSQSHFWAITELPRIIKLLNRLKPDDDLWTEVAVEYNLVALIEEILISSCTKKEEKTSLLKKALNPSSSANLCPEMVCCILEAGADPNADHIWSDFVSQLPRKVASESMASPAKIQVMELMIEYDADTQRIKFYDGLLGSYSGSPYVPFISWLERKCALSDADLARLKFAIHQKEEDKIFLEMKFITRQKKTAETVDFIMQASPEESPEPDNGKRKRRQKKGSRRIRRKV